MKSTDYGDRSQWWRTAGHPPANQHVPVSSGYNPEATVTPEVPGFGGDLRRVTKEK